MSLARQHLIDPEVCIRCNTCEEICPTNAISHDRQNYAVDFQACDGCGDCLPPCPTGAIDSWRQVAVPHSVPAQLQWEALPQDEAPSATSSVIPADVATMSAAASRAEGGRVPPPWSAAHPYVGLYAIDEPAMATVTGNYRLTADDASSDIRHIVLDFGKTAFPVLEGQSIGIVPPGIDTKTGKPHHVRLYSVASPRDGERPAHNNLAITVKRVTTSPDGLPVHGVASNYLCDRARGDQVRVTGPFGTTFLMPNHRGAKLLMICTGTGAAPMRAMTERRRRRASLDEGVRLALFFGARRPEELPYFGPLMKLPRELIDVELAFSRLPHKPTEYVQDRIRARGDAVAKLLADDDTFVYLCGHTRMEEGVMHALADVSTKAGLSWETLLGRLRREGRFHAETY